MSFQIVTHVIFDLDGLLIDSEPIYQKVMEDIVSGDRFKKEVTLDLKMKVLGTTERRSCETVIKTLGLPLTVDQLLYEFKLESENHLSTVKLMKGAERLLRHLDSCGIPIAIATSSSADAVAIKFCNLKHIYELFHHTVCGSTDPEVKEGKPAPDIFLVAAQRFPTNPAPEHCLVFEDAPNGVTAARSAGMQVVMVPASTTPDELKKEATLVLNSLEDFKPELFGLPPFPIISC